MVQTADGSPEEGAVRNGDDMSMSNPMWAHILRLLDDEEQAKQWEELDRSALNRWVDIVGR